MVLVVLLQICQCRQNLVAMATRVYLRINLPNNTFWIDQERVSRSHDGLAELSEGAVCRCDPVVRIGE